MQKKNIVSSASGWHGAAWPELTRAGNPEAGLMPSSAAQLLMLASPGAVGISAPRAVRETEEHSLSLPCLSTYFFSIFYMSISLKAKITKH